MEKMYFHSVRLKEDDCKGCTHCMRRCPTEAIRIRDGKAFIIEERCIDCGWCIRICPNHAKYAVSDPLDDLKKYKYNVAIPAPSITGQFPTRLELGGIIGGLIECGFDEVLEVAFGAEIVSQFIAEYMMKNTTRPLISSACPAVVRFIQVKFPSLIDHVIPIVTPMDITALYAKRDAAKRKSLKESEIGVFFITPCPAKVTSVKQPVGEHISKVSGTISVTDIYERLIGHIDKIEKKPDLIHSSARGVLWGREGGESKSIHSKIKKLSVDGIHNVNKVLERVENQDLDQYDYIELQACPGGCVGGIFNIEDPFVAKVRIDEIAEKLNKEMKELDVSGIIEDKDFLLEGNIKARPIMLDSDIQEAMRKASRIKEIIEELPGIDCGACGCPTCDAFAEDIVQGNSKKSDCIVIMKEELKKIEDNKRGHDEN